MRFSAFAAAAALILTGCAGTISGSGVTNRNETVTGVAVTDGRVNESFEYISNTGWTCRGVLTEQQARQVGGSVTVPLTCSDGRTGTSVLTAQMWQGQLTGQFSLSDGTTGTVIFNAFQ